MKCPTKLLNNFHHTLSMFSHYLDKFNSSLCCETVRSAILAIACLLVTCSFPAITICSLSFPCPALYFHWIGAVLGLAVSRKSETRDGRRDEQTDGQYWLNVSVCLSVCLPFLSQHNVLLCEMFMRSLRMMDRGLMTSFMTSRRPPSWKFQMPIPVERVVRSTSCLTVGYDLWGRRTEYPLCYRFGHSLTFAETTISTSTLLDYLTD